MSILYIPIFLLCLWKIRFSKAGFFDGFLSKEQTCSINGIFILFVFCRHIVQYIIQSGYSFSSPFDKAYLLLDRQLGQFIVVTFLFYSGYGIMESIKKKKREYVRQFPIKRILPTLLNFDVAVFAFFILAILLEKPLDTNIPLAFIGWDSFGNSNWYIFDILLCYCITWISFSISSNSKTQLSVRTLFFMLLLFAGMILFLATEKKDWWYNTILTFPAGVIFSAYKEKWLPILKKYYRIFLPLSIFIFAGFRILPNSFRGILYNLDSLACVFCILLLSMKIQVQNGPLKWLGAHLFPLYIYQRLPMIALFSIDGGNFVKQNPILYVLICFGITLLIAFPYKYWQISFSKFKRFDSPKI